MKLDSSFFWAAQRVLAYHRIVEQARFERLMKELNPQVPRLIKSRT